jgi:ribonuclease P protein component
MAGSPAVDRLRRRADFLAVSAGARAATKAFVLLGRRREAENGPARVGLTTAKKIGSAVERNRIRRRLRALVRQTAPYAARDGFDYVLIARREALHVPFEEMSAGFVTALRRVHAGEAGAARPKDEVARS